MSLFQVETKTFCGFGITAHVLPNLVTKNTLVLTDDAVFDKASEYGCYTLATPPNEPTYSGLQILLEHIRPLEWDCIVGLGGGSAMDYAKALAVLYTNPGKAIDYRGFDKVQNPGLPTILIPTTAGTGSEVTPNAVFTDTDTKTKLGINGRHMRATYAILDAEWTLTCPYSVALSSLLDAFVHAVESYMSPEATPLTRALSREAFRLLYQNALVIKARYPVNVPDKQQLQNLLYGSYLAAMALSNSGSGIIGAMSYPLGVHFGIPHGFAGGIFLPDIVRHNTEKGYDFSGLHYGAPGVYTLPYLLGDLWKRLEVPNLKQWIRPENHANAQKAILDILEETWAKNPVLFDHENALEFVGRHL